MSSRNEHSAADVSGATVADSSAPKGTLELQKSPNWDKLCESEGFIEEGFPFDEGFPNVGPFEHPQPEFTVIFRGGERLQAVVDFSTQYRAEGINWRILTPGEFSILGKGVIAAWCQIDPETGQVPAEQNVDQERLEHLRTNYELAEDGTISFDRACEAELNQLGQYMAAFVDGFEGKPTLAADLVTGNPARWNTLRITPENFLVFEQRFSEYKQAQMDKLQ